MENKFSPNLLDNDPNFEPEPSKVIKVDSQAWFAWLTANDSFRFVAGDNSYRARKEYNIPAKTDYWYAVKKVNGKLHKKFIGKTEQMTHARLIEISKLIMQPPQPRKPVPQENITTTQETSNPDLMELIQSLSLRLDNLEAKQEVKMSESIDNQLFEDAIARLKYELANKEIQISELNDRLANADMHLCHTYNDLHDKEKRLSELANELANKDIQLLELTKQLDNANMQLSELDKKLTNDIDNSLSNEQIIEILGISEIIKNKGNKDFKIYLEWLQEQGIAENIINHRESIEKSLKIKIGLQKILGDLKAILEAMGYRTHYSKNRANSAINEVNCDIKSSSYFMLL